MDVVCRWSFQHQRKQSGVILEKEGEIVVELSIKFNFPISNNQAKYEALIAGLQLASDVGATQLTVYSNS